MAKRILAWSKTATQFYREIGKKKNGRTVRFYLGADDKQAVANTTRLEALWEGVETRWQDLHREGLVDDTFPCWDDLTLLLGRAIAKGEWAIAVEPPENGSQETAVWLASLRIYFPMIRVDVADTHKVEEGNRQFIEAGEKMAAVEETRQREQMGRIKSIVMPFGGKVTTKETLHDALDAYKAWIERTFVDIDGRMTQTGKKQGERALRIKRHINDMPLSDFGTHEIEEIIEFWRTRPKKQDGRPYAFTLCKHTIRLFKHFVRWLHKEKSFPWTRPVELDLDRVKIVPDNETKYRVETYSKEELAILWQHASFFERQLLLLALNCGFSISEIGKLKWTEVDGSYIKGLRPKTKVYGEFRLWALTKQALGEPKKQGPVLVTKNGRSLIAPTNSNNPSANIPRAWYRLLNTMGVFLRHGKPVKSDTLAGVYSNPAFERVFEAQDRMWEFLKDIFTPLGEVELPRRISPATIRQIRALKKQGVRTKKLAEMFNINPTTVRAYCRKK